MDYEITNSKILISFKFKVAGLKMTPFIKSVILYFVIGGFEHYEQVWSTVLKVIPIFCLMGFIFLYGFKLTKE